MRNSTNNPHQRNNRHKYAIAIAALERRFGANNVEDHQDPFDRDTYFLTVYWNPNPRYLGAMVAMDDVADNGVAFCNMSAAQLVSWFDGEIARLRKMYSAELTSEALGRAFDNTGGR